MARFGSICRQSKSLVSSSDDYECEEGTETGTHRLAVEVMLARHDGVDRADILESEEAKAARAARLHVAHDHAVGDAAELLEVGLERVCGRGEEEGGGSEVRLRLRLEGARGLEREVNAPSVVSQLRPPMNILL